MKNNYFTTFVALGFLLFSVPVVAMNPHDEEENRYSTLQKWVGLEIYDSLEKDAKEGKYDRIIQLRNPSYLHLNIQDLIFPAVYRPDLNSPLNFIFMSFMTNIDLSESGLYEILKKDPTALLPLIESPFLKTLNIASNELGSNQADQIEDCEVWEHIRCLSSFTNLTNLNVEHNYLLRYVHVLSSLTNLLTLNVARDGFCDQASVLTPLTNLTFLDVTSSALGGHASALTSLTNLTHLSIHWDNLSDADARALASLTNLILLDVGKTSLGSNIHFLTSLTNLRAINLEGNEIGEDVSAVSSLLGLTHLNVSNNRLTSHISSLIPLTNLTQLNVSWNELEDADIYALAQLKTLQGLSMYTMNLRDVDIGPLTNLIGLKNLQMQNTAVGERISLLSSLIEGGTTIWKD